VLLLFGLALILNVSTSAAANVTDHTSPQVTAVNPVNNSVVLKSQPIKVTFNEPIKAGKSWIELKNGKTVISSKNSISGKTLSIIPTNPLATGIKYNLVIHTGSVTDLSGNGNKAYVSSFTVSTITLAQMKDGLSRAQTFFNNNQRLPNYVSYGSNKIPIAKFQKIIATQGLKINTKIKTSSSNATIAQIMISASKFRYSGAAHTGAAMERIGSGDCWAMSDYLYTHMKAAGITARIIQYSTAYSSRHRSVQYENNGKWVNAPYRQYFTTNMFNNTQSSGTVIACNL
jgi:methionine-rich copper-binding protein CopC